MPGASRDLGPRARQLRGPGVHRRQRPDRTGGHKGALWLLPPSLPISDFLRVVAAARRLEAGRQGPRAAAHQADLSIQEQGRVDTAWGR